MENSNYIVCGKNGEIPFALNFSNPANNENLEIVKYKSDEYYFLHSTMVATGSFVQIKHFNRQICVSQINELSITIDGDLVLSENVRDVSYSHYEVLGDLCIIYFLGKRKYFIVIKGNELCCANYYDELNLDGEERFYLCRLRDSLNHGKVCHIKDKKYDDYLV